MLKTMSNKTISLDVLLEHVKLDEKKLFRLIKRNNLPQIPKRKPIDLKKANIIAEYLTSKPIDYYNLGVQLRTIENQGPFQKHKASYQDSLRVEKLYNKLNDSLNSSLFSKNKDKILAIVVIGGFIGGTEESPLFFTLDDGLNVLIGDRGSGKSTLLNLLGILSKSTTQMAKALIPSLLDSMNSGDDRQKFKEFLRMKSILTDYGIKKFWCFYKIKTSQVYCWHANIEKKYYQTQQLYTERGGKKLWKNANGKVFPTPSVQMFLQGEVFRIADSDDKTELSSLLGALFPEFQKKRLNIGKQIIKFKKRLDAAITDDYNVVNSQSYDSFIDNFGNFLTTLSYSSSRLEYKNQLKKYIDNLLLSAASFPENYLSHRVLYLIQGDDLTQSQKEKIWVYIYVIPVRKEFEKYSYDLEKSIDNHDSDLNSFGLDVYAIRNFLIERLDFLKTTYETYSTFLIGTKIQSLFMSYHDLVIDRKSLLKDQGKLCAKVTDGFKDYDGNYSAIFETDNEKELLNKLDYLLELLEIPSDETKRKKISVAYEAYSYLEQRDMNGLGLSSVQNFIKFSGITKFIFKNIKETSNWVSDITESPEAVLFDPIKVSMRQGKVYRPFQNLSFGQRSGLILRLILNNTSKDIVLLDQPEDHIDTDGINTFLNVAINDMLVEKQIIIATHNSHLVMAFPKATLICLEGGSGDTCTLRSRSSVQEKEGITQVLNVLEGGQDAFKKRIETYNSLLNLLKETNTDHDLSLIEKSFRRRTLDDLRNDLQPIFTDNSLLRVARHELINENHSILKESLLSFRKSLEKDEKLLNDNNLFSSLDDICKKAEKHINRWSKKVEKLGRLDTKATKEELDLFTLLNEIKTEYELKYNTDYRNIEIIIDEKIRNKTICFDRNHFILVFENLIENSLTSTDVVSHEKDESFIEIIEIKLSEELPHILKLRFEDNGEGLTKEGLMKIYKRRYTTNTGQMHGLGTQIIKSLLLENKGDISIVNTSNDLTNSFHGLVQEILLPVYIEK